MTAIEDLTNEQLDVAVAEKVMEWQVFTSRQDYFDKGMPQAAQFNTHVSYPAYYHEEYQLATCVPKFSTNIAHAFQVDKPEWEWNFGEHPAQGVLLIYLWDLTRGEPVWDSNQPAASLTVPLDMSNKVSAYCRGRCICALKACGVEDV